MKLKYFSFFLVFVGLFFLKSEVPNFIIYNSFLVFLIALIPRPNHVILNILKFTILIGSCFFLWKKYHSFLATDMGISLILILSFLKILELKTLDDFFNMFLILILLESAIFIANPSVAVFILGIFKIILYFYYLLQLRKYDLNVLNFKRIFLLIMPAVLFAFLLYFTFPRFTQGFIGFNSSDLFSTKNSNIEVNKLGSLSLTDKKIFTVYGVSPEKHPVENLYWRESVLWNFKKNQWRSGVNVIKKSIDSKLKSQNSFSYQVKTENIFLEYLPHLDAPTRLSVENKKLITYSDDSFKISPGQKINLIYDAVTDSALPFKINSELEKVKFTRIQDEVSEDILKQLNPDGRLISSISYNEKIKIVENYFIRKKYEYSTEPPIYDSITEFILNGKLGYCSHFASAYAYLLRIVGIPSRVVIGFQGGEINPYDQSIIVRERDSHAWVEYLNENSIWMRIDPTELVAPERIKLGSSKFFEKLNPFVGNSYFKFPKSWLASSVGLKIDYLTSYVESSLSNNVFNLDLSSQKKYFKNKSGLYFVTALVLFLTISFFISRIKFNSFITSEEKKYLKFKRKLYQLGLVKDSYETANEFRLRAKLHFPDLAHTIDQETDDYINFFYRN